MTFDDILDQVITLLKRQGRVSYRALKMRFEDIDDEYLDVLKEEVLFSYPQVVDEGGRGFVWTGEPEGTSVSPSQPAQTSEQPPVQQVQPTQVESPPEPHAPDAERRQLTVMFSDLVDSTKLSGQLDPEDYREVLRAYQSTCSEVIQRFGGYIAQHLGDALLVYFGFPTAHENDAQRAILTGLGMLDAMETLNTHLEREKTIRLAIRVGIHTGLTVVGDVGEGQKHELLALGEAPNIASRIQGIAEPNTVVISTATFRLVDGYFICDDLGFHTLKGVGKLQQVYRILRETGAQSRMEVTATLGLTPLVGRDQEVMLLLDRWERVKNGAGHVVLLNGEAGIGKSRLVQVIKEHVAGTPHFRWECRCSPYHQHSALYPIIDLFARAFRYQREDTPEERLRKMKETLAPFDLHLPSMVPLFASMLSVPLGDSYPTLTLSPEQQKQKTLEAILTLLHAVAAQQPVLLIVEDLHWVDPSTLEFLNLLVDQVPTTHIFTLLAVRPDFHVPWTARAYLTHITLARLIRQQVEAMITQIAHGKSFPAEIVEQIVSKTDGVPLFVEEMVRTVMESGLLREADGQYEMTGPLPPLAIPATLHDSLMARLDRLATVKAVAQLGATLGRTFSYELLQAVSSLDAAALGHALGQLVNAELLYQRGLPPKSTYIFKHALIQETAYQSLLKSTRHQYHQRIAQVLADQFSETAEIHPEILAHHYTEAGLLEQAIPYWHQAGQYAVQRSANKEAIAHLTKGLETLRILPDTPERAQYELTLQTTLGPALMADKGQGAPEVGQAYARARELCRQVGETPQLFPVLWGLWRFYFMRTEHQTARELAEQCLGLAQRLQDPTLLLEAHLALGGLLFLGELVPARASLEQGMALYNPQQHRALAFHYGQDPGVTALSYASYCLWMLGYPDQALQRIHEALTLAQMLSHPLSLAAALTYASQIHWWRGEEDAAQERAEAAMTLSSEQGFPQYLSLGTIHRGCALAIQGQAEKGIAQIRQGLTARVAKGVELARSWALAVLAEAYGKADQIHEGLHVLAEALALVDNSGERWWEAETHRLKGALLLQQSSKNAADAETCFHQAIAIAQNQQAKSWELRAATSLARLWQFQNKRQDAHDLLAPVYNWFTEGFDTADLKDAKALLDDLN